MQKQEVSLPEIKLVGITVRTNNVAEQDATTAKISPTVQRYFHNMLFKNIAHRVNPGPEGAPGTTYCAYTDYESDHTGDYTYFIGEEVSSFEDVPEGFETLTIPPQRYVKFTTEPGPMPDVLRNAWSEIWQMTPEQLGGQRQYLTDFELYDERASDYENAAVLDVLIGIK